MNKLFRYFKFRLICYRDSVASWIRCLPRNPKVRVRTSRAAKKWIFFFFFKVYFNILSVLSVPASRSTDILSCFPTINYRILSHMGSKDRFIADKFYCFRRLQNRRIAPAEFLSDSLPYSLPRSHAAVLGILLIKYISNVAEVAIFVRPRRHRRRRRQDAPASYTASHLKPEKWNAGFHTFYAWFSYVSPISTGMELRSLALRAGEAPL